MSIFAVVPVKDLRETKSRLGNILEPGARAGLTLYMMGRAVSVLREAGIEDICVVSPDRIALDMARERGATPLLQESRGLNPALEEARRWAVSEGASAVLVLPADLPLLGAWDVRAVLDGSKDKPRVVISPDDSLSGTNALFLRPPDAMPFAFGPDSFGEHLRLARERGLAVEVRERPNIAFDLDTSEDLARLGAHTEP